MNKKNITVEMVVEDTHIKVMRVENIDYISLTDLAKYQNSTDPSFTIKNWLRRINTIDYVGLWEQIHNESFNLVEFDQIKTEYGKNSFSMSPSQWIKRTNAIGFIAKGGKYSIGTYAHPDIAFEFASWLSPEFKLYLITEFERLKIDESYQSQVEWSVKRELAKTNYIIHTNSIKEFIVPTLTEFQKQYVYASEADVLNVALFGMTAKEWRDSNPDLKGNIRDYADVLHLIVLTNLENLNAEMIANGVVQKDRIIKLNDIAKKQLQLLKKNIGVHRLEDMNNQLEPKNKEKLLNK